MPEAKDEEKAPVKDELKEDADAPASKRKTRKRKTGDEKQEEGATKKDEEGEEEDGEEGVAPEAEPSFARNEVASGTTKFREDAVHVYGLDFLKTGHMEEIFGQFNHRFIEWINDSSANVVFRDAASARKALESLSYPKAGDDPWRRTPDILVHDDLPAVFLQMRLAVSTDSKDRKKAIPSMNPPTYIEESNRRNPNFTMATLYDKKERTAAQEKEDAEKKEANEGKKGKRGPQALPTAEVAKRAKRAERFEATLGEAPKSAEPAPEAAETPAPASEGAAATDAKAATGSKEKAPEMTAEEMAEEAARREKRALRFAAASAKGDEAEAAAAEAAAEPAAGDAESTKEAPAAAVAEASES